MLVIMDNPSPVRGCRGGSTVTSPDTSFSRSAVISCSLLWRMDGYPPVGQDSACAIVNNCPKAQCEASIGADQPYCRQRASRYTALRRVTLYRSSSITMSQLDDGSCMLPKRCEDSSHLASVCKTLDMSEICSHSCISKIMTCITLTKSVLVLPAFGCCILLQYLYVHLY